MNDLQKSILYANPMLSRFDPLSRILCHDDFDLGLQGWSELVGNYEDSLDSMLPEFADLRPPMLSNLTMWDTGTAGSMEGTYALKLASRPRPGAIGVAIKRQTWRQRGPVQLEFYFSFKPEATELRLSELDVRAFGVLFDIQDAEKRWMPHLRYLNAYEGKQAAKWQFKSEREPMQTIGATGKTRSHFHLGPSGWTDVPNGDQLLCYNEIATKMNWHYLKVNLDFAKHAFTGLQCNDRVFSTAGMETMQLPTMSNLWCMMNVSFWVETDCNKRAFLYLDSVLLSTELNP
jgi:hypothetical protein